MSEAVLDELAEARRLPAAERLERTRTLLERREVAADARAWAQLAAAALRVGQLDVAADAAGEGLARDGDDEVLLELVRRARGEVEVPVPAHAWRADGRWLAAAGRELAIAGGTTVDLWSVDGVRGRALDVEASITCLAADRERVVVGTELGELHVWDLRRDRVEVLETEPAQSDAQRTLGFSAAMAFGIGGGSLDQYPELVTALTPTKLPVRAVAIQRATIAAANEVHLAMWPERSYAGRLELAAEQLGIAGHEVIALRAGELVVRPRDAFAGDSSAPTRTCPAPPGITALHVRGGVVYAGGDDGVVGRYPRARVEAPLRGHTGRVTAIASGDELVVSAADDGTVRWWRDGHAIGVAEARVHALAVTDAGIAASLDAEGRVTTWECARAWAPRVAGRVAIVPERGEPFAVALAERPLHFGRHLECDVRLDDRRVSHRMFTIERVGDRYRLFDHSTLTGTWVNGVRVQEAIVLRDGDWIEVIGFRIVFER